MSLLVSRGQKVLLLALSQDSRQKEFKVMQTELSKQCTVVAHWPQRNVDSSVHVCLASMPSRIQTCGCRLGRTDDQRVFFYELGIAIHLN